VFVFILYSNRTGRPPLFPTVGPRQPETTTLSTPIFPLGGFIPLTLQFAADLVHSAYVPVCFRRDHRGPAGLGSDGLGDILVPLDAPQQAEEVGPSQLTYAAVGTQPTQPLGGATSAVGGATPAGRATPAGGAAGSSHAAMATPSPDQLGPRVVRAPDPWTYDRDHTWAGARAVRPKRHRHI
jgi:hypothetical protein